MNNQRPLRAAKVCFRVALGTSFLIATGDRLGMLGPYGSRNIAWGDWSRFVQYVGVLNWFVPKALIPGLAVFETIIEAGLGVALVLGVYEREVAWTSAVLLMLFALTMSVALGVLAPLSYSVFTAAGGAFLLGAAAVPHQSGPRLG